MENISKIKVESTKMSLNLYVFSLFPLLENLWTKFPVFVQRCLIQNDSLQTFITEKHQKAQKPLPSEGLFSFNLCIISFKN